LTFNYLLPVLDDNIASAFRPDIIYELNVRRGGRRRERRGDGWKGGRREWVG
jgi:hypothetical protein